MFTFARTSAKTLLLTAGFVALSGGIASAAIVDGSATDLNAVAQTGTVAEKITGPITASLGGLPRTSQAAPELSPAEATDLGSQLGDLNTGLATLPRLLIIGDPGVATPLGANGLPTTKVHQSSPVDLVDLAALPTASALPGGAALAGLPGSLALPDQTVVLPEQPVTLPAPARSAQAAPVGLPAGLPELSDVTALPGTVAPATTKELRDQVQVQQAGIDSAVGQVAGLASAAGTIGLPEARTDSVAPGDLLGGLTEGVDINSGLPLL
ncbi:hypothetical protein [Nocardiopsis ansamitocini]|uniref:ATP-binding protein n=1 Tax=Nocardiopsis ansamitocini TaxID=1670832 RepID=A0A9W6P4M6_9ACTN|nr:hypothetical protein [Nocardiopsis ansamitocini]GLU47130.1 hypothetical protein Nans01_14810 [Nocardiopsis ansamitocini]